MRMPISSSRTTVLYILAVLSVALLVSPLMASEWELSGGQTLYVPVYSNVYSGPRANPLQLATMLSIHNADPNYSITVLKADYHNSSGKLVESYLRKPIVLRPFAHTYIYLKEYDTRGGPGANFIVKWRADRQVNTPIVEALMFDTKAGISFVAAGRPITEHVK